jgi:hypothetical protein
VDEATYVVIGGDGKERGPVNRKELLQLLFNKVIAPDALVRRVDSNRWVRLDDMVTFESATEPPPAAIPMPPFLPESPNSPAAIQATTPSLPQPISKEQYRPPEALLDKGPKDRTPWSWIDVVIPTAPLLALFLSTGEWKRLGGDVGSITGYLTGYFVVPIVVFAVLRRWLNRLKSVLACGGFMALVGILAAVLIPMLLNQRAASRKIREQAALKLVRQSTEVLSIEAVNAFTPKEVQGRVTEEFRDIRMWISQSPKLTIILGVWDFQPKYYAIPRRGLEGYVENARSINNKISWTKRGETKEATYGGNPGFAADFDHAIGTNGASGSIFFTTMPVGVKEPKRMIMVQVVAEVMHEDRRLAEIQRVLNSVSFSE